MYVTEIELRNLRCFQGTHRISLNRVGGTYAGWTVITGRSGAGAWLRSMAGDDVAAI